MNKKMVAACAALTLVSGQAAAMFPVMSYTDLASGACSSLWSWMKDNKTKSAGAMCGVALLGYLAKRYFRTSSEATKALYEYERGQANKGYVSSMPAWYCEFASFLTKAAAHDDNLSATEHDAFVSLYLEMYDEPTKLIKGDPNLIGRCDENEIVQFIKVLDLHRVHYLAASLKRLLDALTPDQKEARERISVILAQYQKSPIGMQEVLLVKVLNTMADKMVLNGDQVSLFNKATQHARELSAYRNEFAKNYNQRQSKAQAAPINPAAQSLAQDGRPAKRVTFDPQLIRPATTLAGIRKAQQGRFGQAPLVA